MNKTKEEILKKFDKEFGKDGFYVETSIDCNNNYTNTEIKQFISKALDQTREETIREEIAYWTDVFDNRPKDRDLESDNIAQNFARIEIERLENKLK